MKLGFIAMVALTLFGSFAYANTDDTQTILESSMVKTTFALMQARHKAKCIPLTTTESVNWMCLGAIPPVTKLSIVSGSCGFRVAIVCGNEQADIFGDTRTVFAVDAKGMRNDIDGINLGISFDEFKIGPKRK
jgi:hypothetical protein